MTKEETIEELALVDHPSGLSAFDLSFLRYYAQSGLKVQAYKEAWAQAYNEPLSQQKAGQEAFLILKKAGSKQYLRTLMDRLEDMAVMKMHQAQIFLTEAITTPISEIDEHHILCQKKTVTKRTDKDGTETETTNIDSINKLEALKTLARMKGWDAPIEVNHNHIGGVMRVPMTNSHAEWEKLAAQSQHALMQDAINIDAE